MSFFWVIGLGLVVLVTFAVGQGSNQNALVASIVFFPAALALYFAPTGVAAVRRHPKGNAIFVLNLLAGWTVIGWIIAIVWAYAGGSEPGDPDHKLTSGPMTKKCPYCAEEILAAAGKCRYCKSDLVGSITSTEARRS